jgi:hypothetical protein
MSKVEADIRKQQKQRATAAPKQKKAVGAKRTPPVGGEMQIAAPTQGRADSKLVLVGREPRVDLLPTEVHVDRRERAGARRAWLGVVLVVAVVALGVGGASLNAVRSQARLASAQSATVTILQEQQKYSAVRAVQSATSVLTAAQAVGGAEEISWAPYLRSLAATLPAGTTISDINALSANPLAPFDQASVPLQGARIATLELTVQSTELPSVPDWTDGLASTKGYVDSNISSISANDGGGWTATITLHVNEKAYDGKYWAKD